MSARSICAIAVFLLPWTAHAQKSSSLVECRLGVSGVRVTDFTCDVMQAGFKELSFGRVPNDSWDRCAVVMSRMAPAEEPVRLHQRCESMWKINVGHIWDDASGRHYR
jgi:hypothetical protein